MEAFIGCCMRVSNLVECGERMSQVLQSLGDSRGGDITALAPRALEALRDRINTAASLLREATPLIGDLPSLDTQSNFATSPQSAQTLIRELAALLDLRCQSGAELPISVGRISRALGKLRTAAEAYEPFDSLVYELASAVSEQSPEQYPDRVYLQVAKTLVVLGLWEWENAQVDRDLTRHEAIPTLLRNLGRDEPVAFSFFICPPAYYPALCMERPEQYYPTCVEGSFLQSQAPALRDLTERLRRIGVPARIVAVIGDCDEVDYLWPVLGPPSSLTSVSVCEAVEERKSQFQEAVFRYLERSGIAAATDISVLRLSRLKPPFRAQLDAECANRLDTIANDPRWFNERDRYLETQRMEELWAPGSYYEGLPAPSEEQLAEIVRRKFAAYAEEGLLLGGLPGTADSILIQLEKPPLLRNRMLNAAREMRGSPSWPALLLYPPEDRGTMQYVLTEQAA